MLNVLHVPCLSQAQCGSDHLSSWQQSLYVPRGSTEWQHPGVSLAPGVRGASRLVWWELLRGQGLLCSWILWGRLSSLLQNLGFHGVFSTMRGVWDSRQKNIFTRVKLTNSQIKKSSQERFSFLSLMQFTTHSQEFFWQALGTAVVLVVSTAPALGRATGHPEHLFHRILGEILGC